MKELKSNNKGKLYKRPRGLLGGRAIVQVDGTKVDNASFQRGKGV